MDKQTILEELRAEVARSEARLPKLAGRTNALIRASEEGCIDGLKRAIRLLEAGA